MNKSTQHFKDQISLVKQSFTQLSDVMVEEFEALRNEFRNELQEVKRETAKTLSDQYTRISALEQGQSRGAQSLNQTSDNIRTELEKLRI